MSAPLSPLVRASVFLRTFLIQGSWNYHTMIGCGFAFALLPLLRRLHAEDPQGLRRALDRHVEHFNAHPYLAGLAVGAAVRLEADGEDPEVVRRLKTALRGPLGGVGDALMWATWLPLASMVALALVWAGAPGALAVAAFFFLYNAGHLLLRAWAFETGLRRGTGVARSRGLAAMSRITQRLRAVTVLALGVLCGLALQGPASPLEPGPAVAVLAAASFLVGLTLGQRAWRPAAAVVVAAVGALTVVGML